MSETKLCCHCKIEKHKSQFGPRKDRPSGLQSNCRMCEGQRQRIYETTSGGKQTRRRYDKTVHGKLSHSKFQKTARGKEVMRRYQQSDKGRLLDRQCARRKRERKLRLDTSFTNAHAKLVYSRFSNRCFNCLSIDRLEIDHHMPLSLGYGLTLENAVLLCKSCNASKGSKLPEEFYMPDKLSALEKLLRDNHV